MIIFKSRDFLNLKDLFEINERNKEYEYSSQNDEREAKPLNKEVKKKIKKAEQFIKTITPFDKLVAGACHRKKRGNGKYRANLWVWLVNRNKYNYLKQKGGSTHQLYLPQLQFGIHRDEFTTGEIWIDNYAIDAYKKKFIKIFENANFDKNNLWLYVEFKDKEKKGFQYSLKNFKHYKNFLLSDHAAKTGVSFHLSKKDAKNRNISQEIIKSLKILNKHIYSKLFNAGSGEENVPPHVPHRKPSKKKTVASYFRKGIKPTKVTAKHNLIQNDLVALLKAKYGDCVKTEKDYIDILVENRKIKYLYEIKTNKNPVKCIREAIGQILYYLWVQKMPKNKDTKLIIIGLNDLDINADKYFDFLKNKLDINIEYDSVKNLLNGKIY